MSNRYVCRLDALLAVAALALVWSACGAPQQDHASPGRVTTGAQEGARATPALSDATKQLLGWLPADGAVPGWSRAGEPRRYGPGNLWEYIDGGAEMYLPHGFEELATTDYVNTAGLRVTVDLYRMETPLGAFGIYAQELDPGSSFLPIGGEGYRHGTALNFWSASCYVKLTSARDDPGLPAGLEAIARAIATRIGPTAARPIEFSRFPAANLVAHSFKTVPKDVLGQSYLSGAFEAEYRSGAARYKVTLIPCPTGDEARAAFARYQAFSSSTHAARSLQGLGEAAFSATDSYYGLVVVARRGRSIGIVSGAPSEREARAILSKLL